MFCPLCDGLGMIEDPLRPGRLKKCPECDTPPSAYFLPLAAWVGEPEPGEVEHYEALNARRLERERAEDAVLRRGDHGGVTGMTPEVLCDGVTLYEGDALDVLRSMPDASVDHVVTDPPYAEKTHAGARGQRPGETLTTAKLVTFDSIDDEAFKTLCLECVRVARRWVLMTCDWRHSAAAECGGLPVVRCGVWVKPDSAPQFTGDRPGTGWEAVLILHRPGRKRWNGGGHHAVWTHGVERGNEHPTQKPLALVRKWVRDFTDPGDVILDPFAGSGTTAVAAIREDRAAVLVERDPAYCGLIRRRIRAASGVGSLFAEAP